MDNINKIRKYYFSHNQLPSLAEAAVLIGASSKTTISRLYKRMIDLGYLYKKEKKYYPTDLLGALPLYGSVQAGAPTEESSEIIDQVNISSFLIENPDTTFLATVRGDSMSGSGLVEGDIVIVDRSYTNPRISDIVIATVDDDNEFTIKYYGLIKNKPVLVPDNSQYSIIIPKSKMTIHGKVIGSLRKY